MLILLRHAKAGSRKQFDGEDFLRPLTDKGRAQSAALVEQMKELPITAILTSAYVRCSQTMEPLSEATGIVIASNEALAEGSASDAQVALLDSIAGQTVVLCSHGDVLGSMLELLKQRGFPVEPDRCEKGSMWLIHESGEAEYVSPPSSEA